MKLEDLLTTCGDYPYFSLAFLRQVSGEDRNSLRQNIVRWMKRGIMVRLRNGMYSLADPYRKRQVFGPKLSNDLYRPSYLTGAWALSFYGLIPDVAQEYTSATLRRPQTFSNEIGRFSYRHLSREYFWGDTTVETRLGKFRGAAPEKALIDYWYWEKGNWDLERMREMRLQNLEKVDLRKLESMVARMSKPKVTMAYRNLLDFGSNSFLF